MLISMIPYFTHVKVVCLKVSNDVGDQYTQGIVVQLSEEIAKVEFTVMNQQVSIRLFGGHTFLIDPSISTRLVRGSGTSP